MTSAGLLVCMTIVTNINHGSVVTHVCQDQQPHVAMVSPPVVPSTSIVTAQMPDKNVKSLAIVEKDVQAMPQKRQFKMSVLHKAKVRNLEIRKTVTPVMTTEQNKAFRLSWFDRMAAK